MNEPNKKYLVDISLEIDSDDIRTTNGMSMILTKEIDGRRLFIELPVSDRFTARDLKDGTTTDCYHTDGWWIREKDETNASSKSGIEWVMEQRNK